MGENRRSHVGDKDGKGIPNFVNFDLPTGLKSFSALMYMVLHGTSSKRKRKEEVFTKHRGAGGHRRIIGSKSFASNTNSSFTLMPSQPENVLITLSVTVAFQ
ncbi:hypothetical protein Taro_053463 [Colocasia esculenta]|uniref:Uncharacterized protein n=1 Tax=Colocasia esculenta TaxID=4460 RepID=A0A843XMN0_COLES|nr:hypothetical protein [Colocasia esculenta]